MELLVHDSWCLQALTAGKSCEIQSKQTELQWMVTCRRSTVEINMLTLYSHILLSLDLQYQLRHLWILVSAWELLDTSYIYNIHIRVYIYIHIIYMLHVYYVYSSIVIIATIATIAIHSNHSNWLLRETILESPCIGVTELGALHLSFAFASLLNK